MRRTQQNKNTPIGQDDFKPWELKVMLACHGVGVTAEDLSHVLKRTPGTIGRKASMQGVSLKRLN